MLVELHLLTSHAPASLNRDDAGRPKTALFGGVERARISSQAQKRALRTSPVLRERLAGRLSTRTKELPKLLFGKLQPSFPDREERLRTVCEALTVALGKPDAKDKLVTSQIVFLTAGEMVRIETHVREAVADDARLTGKAVKELAETMAKDIGLDTRPTDGVDMALFGRMTTDDANSFSSVDASMQVAHPLATHATRTETDYFTAVDDLRAERGTGHIGESDFNSAVFYKYFSCNVDALAENLGGDRAAALAALAVVLDAACRVTPSGKQNSFASHSLADVALLVLRDEHVPCSLANAFERPVESVGADGRERGFLAPSAQALVARYARLRDAYGLADRTALFSIPDVEVPGGLATRAERLDDLWAFLAEHASGTGPATPDVHGDAFDAAAAPDR